MKQYIEKAVSETNRIIYSWLKMHQHDPRFTITESDVKSVFNGWFIRFLKVKFGYAETSRFLRYARPLCLIKDGQISEVRLMVYNEYMTGLRSWSAEMQGVLKTIDYESLKYDEASEHERLHQLEHNKNLVLGLFTPDVDIEFNTLKNIQFV